MLIQMRRLLGGAVAVACLFSTFVTLAAPAAHAQQELIEADPDVVRARAEVQAAQLAAHQAANQLEQATQQRDATQASIDEHVAHLAELDAQRADLAAQRDVLKADLRQRAVSLYRAGGNTGRLEALNADNAVQAARRAQLGDIAARTTQRASQKLEDTRTELGKVQDTLRAEESDLRQQKASLDDQVGQQERLQTVMAQKVDAANAALARARALGALRRGGRPDHGPVAAHRRSTRAVVQRAELPPAARDEHRRPRADLHRRGQRRGRARRLRVRAVDRGDRRLQRRSGQQLLGDRLVRQLRDREPVPEPREGVRAQIQLLVNYADANARAANLHHPVSPYLYGSDPVAAARKFDNFFARGWAPTWRDMGHGNWATAPNYAEAVIGVYNRMKAFAQGG